MTIARGPRALVACAVAGAAGLGLAACAAIAGIDAPHDRPADASLGSQVEAGGEGGTPSNEGGLDQAALMACMQRAVDDGNGIFVAPSGNDTLACGTRASPCATIQSGLSQASSLGKATVYVAAGTYVEAVNLVAGVAIEGAWALSGTAWSPSCGSSASPSQIVAPATSNTTVTASALNGAAALRFLSIASKTAAPNAGESLYGVFASGVTTQLTLDGVTVTVGAAGAGVSGGSGTAGADAIDAGCASGIPINGVGDAGAASQGGVFGMNGYATGDGQPGATGASGANGSQGGMGQCQSGCGACDNHCTYLSEGLHSCGTNGLSGCGGAGGQGGQGGQGGGSSVALYAWGAAVTCIDSTLLGGSGGAGGAGGSPGDGGAPSVGLAGSATSCATSCGGMCVQFLDGGGCAAAVCGPTLTTLEGGAPGGPGAAGYSGGAGGAGAGGWSCGAFAGGGGSITTMGSTLAASAAGAPGDPTATAGTAAGQCMP